MAVKPGLQEKVQHEEGRQMGGVWGSTEGGETQPQHLGKRTASPGNCVRGALLQKQAEGSRVEGDGAVSSSSPRYK